MNDKVKITVFTDPMMGLSWEMEPVRRKLETHYEGRIEFNNVMGLLVPDVYDLVNPEELKTNRKQALSHYLQRLASIYREEESIHQMPIPMEKCVLFSEDHPSTLPLNLAYYAVRDIASKKAEAFLYRLRYQTVVEGKRTTDEKEILRIVQECGIDREAFLAHYDKNQVREEFQKGLRLMARLNLHSLPGYLMQYQDKAMLFQTFSYEDFVEAIRRITDNSIKPQKPELSKTLIQKLLEKHPLISILELEEALDLSDEKTALEVLKPWIDKGEIETYQVPHMTFVRKAGKE